MKNKNKLYVIIGVIIAVVFILVIDFMFPIKEINRLKVLLERDSVLNDKLKKVEISYIADSEKDNFLIEEKDKKTNEELTEEKSKNENVEEIESYQNNIVNYPKTQFEYNIDNDKIEIIKYNGLSNNIIIPIAIDGYEVTKVNISSFNSNIKSIFIPNVVKEIDGEIKYNDNNKTNFIIANIAVLITAFVFCISILTLSSKNLEENFYNSTSYIFSYLYLIISLIFCYKYRMLGFLSNIFYVKMGITLLIYILLMISLRFYKNKLMNKEK